MTRLTNPTLKKFDKILELLKDKIGEELSEQGNYLKRDARSRFSYLEVIALSLTAECLNMVSKNHLFSKLNNEYVSEFKNRPPQYNGFAKR